MLHETANEIFFATLEQFTTDSSAGAAIIAAVADVLDESDFRTSAKADAQTNLRWFSSQAEPVRVQVIALAAAVRTYCIKAEGRASIQAAPAATRLEHLETAVALYRHLRKRKTAVAAVVEKTQIQTKAAYKAIVRSHLHLINEMRGAKATRAWQTISRMLYQLVHIKIPAQTLAKVYAEVTLETQERQGAEKIMSHFENERITAETRKAFEQAGYANTTPARTPLETLEGNA